MPTIGENTNLANLLPGYMDLREFKRGEIYYVDLEDIQYTTTFIQGKTRPGLIIQNDVGNMHSPTVIIALLTTSYKKEYPFQYKTNINGRDSIIMFEQIMTIDKYRITDKMCELTSAQMKQAESKLLYSLQLNRYSFENLIDFDIVGMVIRKTKSSETIAFEAALYFENNQTQTINISLDNLKTFNKNITKDTPFDELKSLLDCCKGLHWLIKYNNL